MLHTHSPIGFRGSHIRCSAAAALMLAAGSAHGQMWNVGNGNWNVASNWSPMTVPNSMTADVTLGGASGYIVTIGSISPIIQNLAISNANAVLTIGSSRALQPHGDTVINNGLINVNTNGANGSYIQFFNADTLLTGNGVIALNAAGNILDRAYLWYGVSTDVLTQDVNHSILGSGNIYVAMVNNGTINADIDGGILQLFTTNKANAGTIGATNGGILRINGISIDQTGGGAMYAQGAGTNPSEIRLSNATLTGGTLDMLSPAAAFVTAGNATLIDTVVSGTINVENTRNLHIGGALYDHDGTINVNSLSGSSGSSITFGDPATTLSGTGEIVLNASGNILDRAYLNYTVSSNVVTQQAGHVIHGSGNIYTNMIFNGRVSADRDGQLVAMIITPKTNNGVIEAVDGGILHVNGIAVNQSSAGQIKADGAGTNPSEIRLSNALVTGGHLDAMNGTSIEVVSGAATLDSVEVTGQVNITNTRTLNILGSTYDHTGRVLVNSNGGSSQTVLSFNDPATTLSGTGEIELNATGNILDRAYLSYTQPSNVVTQSAGHVIHGSGNIYTNMIFNGRVSADRDGQLVAMITTPKTNNGVIEAINGGILHINGITVSQSSTGQIKADGAGTNPSEIRLTNASITDGHLDAMNGTSIEVVNGTATFDSVEVTGQINILNSRVLNVLGTAFDHDGRTLVNSNGGPNQTVLSFNDPATTLIGTGEIELNATGNILDRAYLSYTQSSNVVTQSAGHLIHGSGNIYTNMVFNGTVSADRDGQGMGLVTNNKTNNGTIEAVDGGFLLISGITLDQTGGGEVVAQGAGTNPSEIRLNGATITHGTIDAQPGTSTNIVSGNTTLNSVTTFGQMNVENSRQLRINDALTNNGTVAINSGGGTNPTLFIYLNPATLDGNGELVLNATGGILDRAYITAQSSADVLTHGQNHTISGNGNFYANIRNEGTLDPGGDAIGRFGLGSGGVDCEPTSVVRMQIGGDQPGQFDRINGSGTFECEGTLVIEHLGGYPGPVWGTFIDIISASAVTGTFDNVQVPSLSGQDRYEVVYLADRVRLLVTCYADCDANSVLNIFDYICFGNAYAGNPVSVLYSADCDGSGTLNIFDYICFGNAYAGGCP